VQARLRAWCPASARRPARGTGPRDARGAGPRHASAPACRRTRVPVREHAWGRARPGPPRGRGGERRPAAHARARGACNLASMLEGQVPGELACMRATLGAGLRACLRACERARKHAWGRARKSGGEPRARGGGPQPGHGTSPTNALRHPARVPHGQPIPNPGGQGVPFGGKGGWSRDVSQDAARHHLLSLRNSESRDGPAPWQVWHT
jgi:hypothetical protein